MNNLKFHQVCHLVFLFLIVILYFISTTINSQNAKEIQTIKTVIQFAGFVWTALVVVLVVKNGVGFDTPKKLLGIYRHFLQRQVYVLILNILLVIGIGYICYSLTFYRDILFFSNKKAILIQNDRIGEVQEIAQLEPNKTIIVRLKHGSRKLIAQSNEGNIEVIDEFFVAPIWKKQTKDEIKIYFMEGKYVPIK